MSSSDARRVTALEERDSEACCLRNGGVILFTKSGIQGGYIRSKHFSERCQIVCGNLVAINLPSQGFESANVSVVTTHHNVQT